MELQQIIWTWDTVTGRIIDREPIVGKALRRSCRPIAAQRYRDGRLLLVLGCWCREDQELLHKEPYSSQMNDALGKVLAERIIAKVVRWPGGLVTDTAPAVTAASSQQPQTFPSEQRIRGQGWEQEQPPFDSLALEEDEGIPAPDILRGLPESEREEASKCESAIQRLFFATAYYKGLHLRCQVPVLNYRLDFAVPDRRVGAEVLGWDWRALPATERREREEQLGHDGWQIVLFSGSQVLSDVDKCVDDLVNAWKTALDKGSRPLPTRYSPEGRKPFSSLGKQPDIGDKFRKKR